jgi:hypothetical protein
VRILGALIKNLIAIHYDYWFYNRNKMWQTKDLECVVKMNYNALHVIKVQSIEGNQEIIL